MYYLNSRTCGDVDGLFEWLFPDMTADAYIARYNEKAAAGLDPEKAVAAIEAEDSVNHPIISPVLSTKDDSGQSWFDYLMSPQIKEITKTLKEGDAQQSIGPVVTAPVPKPTPTQKYSTTTTKVTTKDVEDTASKIGSKQKEQIVYVDSSGKPITTKPDESGGYWGYIAFIVAGGAAIFTIYKLTRKRKRR